jgi:predicted ATPase/DNA-binding SARP family transcriptional activator
MEFRILGLLEVVLDGRALELRAAKVRALLGMLLISPNRVVSIERLAEGLWGYDHPPSAVNTLQGYMSQLRKALRGDSIQTRSPGYLLAVDEDRIDAIRFERLLDEGRRARASGHPNRAVSVLGQALGLWRGEALADFTYAEWAQTAIARLQEQRLVATEEWIEARLELGEHSEVLAELDGLVTAHPLRERLWAARILALYRSGRQADALRAYQELRRALGEELGIAPSPALAALEESVLRQRASLEWRPGDRLSHLPVARSTFVGRDQELIELKKLVQETALLTVVGAGGIGKTRLAVEVAGALSGDYEEVRLAELAALTDPALVVPEIARACDVREETGRALLDTLVDALRMRHLLLVLDNCEHLVETAAGVADAILRGAPHVSILATSRQPLRIEGERVWRVPSLPVPLTDNLAPESLLSFDSVRLFATRAADIDARFKMTPENASAVAQLCRRLDGIPLALELAAARIATLSPAQIAARLDDRFRLLRGGSRAAMPRHQTLSAAVEWSYDLCSMPEQCLFRRLSVFAGGFSLAAAEAICADDLLPNDDILDRLAGLVDRSLVLVHLSGGEPRYDLLETLRAFGSERLSATGERRAVQDRHLQFYFDLATRAEAGIRRARGPEASHASQHAWLDLLELEHDNLRAGLMHAVGTEDGIRLAAALGRFWDLRNHFTEGQGWLLRALAAPGGEADHHRLQGLNALATLLIRSGQYVKAQELFNEALQGATRLGDEELMATALTGLGGLAGFRTELALSRQLHEDALEKWRAVEDDYGVAWALGSLSWVASNQCDFVVARQLQEQSLAIRRAIGDEQGVAWSLASLARVAMAQGDHAEGRRHLEEAVTMCGRLGYQSDMLVAQIHFGELERASGNLDRARSLLEESAALARRIGSQHLTLWSLLYLAGVVQEQGEHAYADRLVAEAISLATALQNKLAVAQGLEIKAHSALLANDYQRASRLLGAAGSLRASIGASVPPYRQQEHNRMSELIRSRMGEASTAEAADDDLMLKRQVEFNDLAMLIAEAERGPRPQDVGSHDRAQDGERRLSQ